MTTSVVITDTSVLINFLVLDQLHVLSQLTEFDFSVTEHVRAEITEHFPEQLQRLSTSELTVCLIKAAILTVEEADNFKKIWEEEYRFKLPFRSFSEFIEKTSE